MDQHDPSQLLKRKTTDLNESFQPIKTGSGRNEKGKIENNNDNGKDTESLMCARPPYKDITQLLTIFPTLYISYPGLIYFATGILYLLISLIYFFPPHPGPLLHPPVKMIFIVTFSCPLA